MPGVIFDMDGTLLDTQRIHVDAWEDVGLRHGIKALGSHVPPCCGMHERAWKQYLREHFPTLDIETFHREVTEYIQQNLLIRFKPGAGELMAFLKEHHIPMAIASGSGRALIEHYFEHLGGLEDFAAVVGGDEVKNCKPAPDIFLLAANRLGLPPESCIVIEDSANGILAGHRAGMRCIGIPDIAPLDAESKQLLLAQLTDLSQVIPLLQPYIER